jgi:hypothetical protein
MDDNTYALQRLGARSWTWKRQRSHDTTTSLPFSMTNKTDRRRSRAHRLYPCGPRGGHSPASSTVARRPTTPGNVMGANA